MLHTLTIKEAHQGFLEKKFSSVELTRACLKRIKQTEPKLNAFISLLEESALEQAKKTDRKINVGEEIGLLEGIPIAIKDNILIQGTKCTAGSKILENYVSAYDAAVIGKLKKAGAIFLGKTNLDEFAMGSSTENSFFGPTCNPWDLKRVPGGSSGGSAAAVAADNCIAALGSDTGGSVRQPASLCGVVGLKPTYGQVSRFGLMALASSLDQIGPLAKCVRDAQILFDIIKGIDENDSTTVDISLFSPKHPREESKNRKTKSKSLKGMKIGVPEEYFVSGTEKDVLTAVKEALRVFEKLGAVIVALNLPHTQYSLPVYYIIMPSEASANLARYDGIRYGYSASSQTADVSESLLNVYFASRGRGFGDEARRRIMLGTFALSEGYHDAYYKKAQLVRALIKKDFETAFHQVDCIIAPTSPTVAWELGEKLDDPLKMYLSDIFTVSVNVAGVPAISVPCGLSRGLPIGMQIIGKWFDEETIFKMALCYEEATEWRRKFKNLKT